jgi:uncharacterized membrane protein YgaE (UPF0421/DUF939 family)
MFTFLANLPRRPYIRVAVLSALAATVAYLVGSFNPAFDATVAGLTALISVRPTFHDTAAESFKQVLGTLVGGVLGLALVHMLGGQSATSSAAIMFLLILVCFVIARFLRVGEEGAAVMGLTVVLVLGPVSDVAKAESRFFGVFLGTVVAMLVSIWVRPGLPHHRALGEALRLADTGATLLTEMSTHISEHQGKVSRKLAKKWVAEAEATMTELAEIRVEAEAALKSARWSPLVNSRDAESVLEQIRIAQVTARTVYNMANDLLVSSRNAKTLPKQVAENLADVLSATADVISEQAETARENPASTLDVTDTTVIDLQNVRDETIGQMRDISETKPILLAGSLLRDSEKITAVVVDVKSEDNK